MAAPPVCINLCSPPSSPGRAPLDDDAANCGGASVRINLCNTSNGNKAPEMTSNAGPSDKALGKRKAETAPPRDDDEEEAECMEVEAQQAAPARPPDARAGEDDDIVCTGRTGSIALSDFPHACAPQPFTLAPV